MRGLRDRERVRRAHEIRRPFQRARGVLDVEAEIRYAVVAVCLYLGDWASAPSSRTMWICGGMTGRRGVCSPAPGPPAAREAGLDRLQRKRLDDMIVHAGRASGKLLGHACA